jgi:uncharacterized protein
MKIKNQGIDRRHFIKLSATFAALMSLPVGLSASISDKWGSLLPTRKLGSTGLDVTMFCMGGGPFDADYDKTESLVETAMKGGCRFFETARRYGRDGESEKGFGRFLTPSYRKEVTLLTKTYANTAEELKRDVDISLENMKTDYIDIYLMHDIKTPEMVEARLKGGVFDELVKAKEEGKIGHIGFSGHSDPEANNYFINKGFSDLEVVLMPINVADAVQQSFSLNTVPVANEKDVGVIGMKIFAGGGFYGRPATWGAGRGQERELVIPDIISKKEAQHYAYSLPIAATTIGCNNATHVEEVLENTRNFDKLSEAEFKELIERITEVALNNPLEHYKNS